MPRMCTCEMMSGSYKYGLKTYSLLMILLGIGFFVFFYFFTIAMILWCLLGKISGMNYFSSEMMVEYASFAGFIGTLLQ